MTPWTLLLVIIVWLAPVAVAWKMARRRDNMSLVIFAVILGWIGVLLLLLVRKPTRASADRDTLRA